VSFMGPKTISIVLVLLMGAVAAYDVKYMLDRKNKMTLPAGAAGADGGDTAAGQPNAPDNQAPTHQPGPADLDRAETAAEAPTAAQLPPVFRMDWVNPFTKEPETTSSSTAVSPGAGTIPQNTDVLAGYNPVISAVLIGTTVKRVVINRQVFAEGDRVPGIGAVVKAVTPAGVELALGGSSRFFPLSPPQAHESTDNQ